jgi:transcriptional regulator with XRE-family HTH domain
MFQRELASKLEIGDGFLSKVENNQKTLKREHLIKISELFNCSLSELEALWIGTKLYEIVKDEHAKLKNNLGDGGQIGAMFMVPEKFA